MSLSPKRKRKRPIPDRKDERELFFWTCEKALVLTRNLLALIFFAASVAFAVVAMLHGDFVFSANFLR